MGYLDTVVDTAKEQLRHVAGAVTNRTGHREPSQSVTIRSDPETVQQFFRDPGRLSEVLGEIAEVQQTGDDTFRWVFRAGPLDGTSWDSRLVADSHQLRFVDAGQNGTTGTEFALQRGTTRPGHRSNATGQEPCAGAAVRGAGLQSAVPRTRVAADRGNTDPQKKSERA
jgi:uncharacterized membrane protein